VKLGEYRQDISVRLRYPVIFARNVFDPADGTLREVFTEDGEGGRRRVLCFLDGGLAAARPGLAAAVEEYCRANADVIDLVRTPRTVPGGEGIKNDYRLLMEVMDTILEYRLCRHSFVLAVGGGAVLDAVGFAASLSHRGLRTVRMPSTVLSQADSGVGVKTGMNLHGVKNSIGTFNAPWAVLSDFALLDSLPFEHWIGGVAEAFKVALIRDADFFEFLTGAAERLRARDMETMEETIRRSAILHLDHIRRGGDPFEFGRARPLDFGHWAAHKLEALSSYRLGHGQAVAVGVAIDAWCAVREGMLERSVFDDLVQAFLRCGLPVYHEKLELRHGDGRLVLLDGLEEFREHIGGRLTLVFPDGLGSKTEVTQLETGLVEEAVAVLRRAAGVRVPG